MISIVDPQGSALMAVRKPDFKRHNLILDNTTPGSNAQIISGVFSNDFVTVFISQNSTQFVQVHRARKSI